MELSELPLNLRGGLENKITINPCCVVCENIYNSGKCPLFRVYSTAFEFGEDYFEKESKYHVCCDKFLLTSRVVQNQEKIVDKLSL